jgi:phosphopantetheinyl transferase
MEQGVLMKTGKLYVPKSLFLRQQIGQATSGKLTFDCATIVPTGEPVIHSKQTGLWFTLSWEDIIALAVNAGIDDPDLGDIGKGHVCKHKVRWPHPCYECAAAFD